MITLLDANTMQPSIADGQFQKVSLFNRFLIDLIFSDWSRHAVANCL